MIDPKHVRLRLVDLSKADKHECPTIREDGTRYLVLHDGRFATGIFGRQWYGLNFSGLYPAGCQFDAPGSNSSRWQAVWEILTEPESEVEALVRAAKEAQKEKQHAR